MKEKIIQKPIYAEVLQGMKEEIVYIAEDGKEFKTKKECLEYDDDLNFNKIINNIECVMSGDLFIRIGIGSWFHPKNLDELNAIKRLYGYNKKHLTIKINNEYLNDEGDQLNIGDWISGEYEDGGDHSNDELRMYTLGFLKSQIKDFLNLFPNE